ncbi:hypothetical protein L1049_018984 [Liquidambar formosana]|uniref:Uncharacterized protein n=1 Tax=Liquidambar formosana TaxID=63359 RepID=A0AAP0RAV1_LIQFO
MCFLPLNCLDKKVDELEEELRGKTIVVAKGKELQEDLIKKFELQASKIKNSEQSVIDHEEEKKLLTANLERLEENVDGLQKEFRKKTEEVEEERKLQEKLIQQIDMNGSEMLKYAQQLEEHEKEKKLLLFLNFSSCSSQSDFGYNYGVILIPEGLIDFIPEVQHLLAELSAILAQEVGNLDAPVEE